MTDEMKMGKAKPIIVLLSILAFSFFPCLSGNKVTCHGTNRASKNGTASYPVVLQGNEEEDVPCTDDFCWVKKCSFDQVDGAVTNIFTNETQGCINTIQKEEILKDAVGMCFKGKGLRFMHDAYIAPMQAFYRNGTCDGCVCQANKCNNDFNFSSYKTTRKPIEGIHSPETRTSKMSSKPSSDTSPPPISCALILMVVTIIIIKA